MVGPGDSGLDVEDSGRRLRDSRERVRDSTDSRGEIEELS